MVETVVLVVSHVYGGYLMSNGVVCTYDELCAWLAVGNRRVEYND
jgi:hypothetical protein